MHETPWSWFKNQWPKLLGIVLAAAMCVALTIAISSTYTLGKDLDVRTIWPLRISYSVPSKVHVYVSSKRHSVSGAKVELFCTNHSLNARDAVYRNDNLALIAKGNTDAHGSVKLVLPNIPLMPKSKNDIRNTDQCDPLGADNLSMLLVVTHPDGRTRTLSKKLSTRHSISSALTLDRPLYQPGQSMHMRLLTLDTDSGAPMQGEVFWKILDPQQNLIFEHTSKTSTAGISSAKFVLASHCMQGSYTIKTRILGKQTIKKVKVHPFRLPRYKVLVSASPKTVQPGGVIQGKVHARYTYGEAVRDAHVEITVLTSRQAGMREEVIKGKTDAQGHFAFSHTLSKGTHQGSAITLKAHVISHAGRAQEGTHTLRVSGADALIEFIPTSAPVFAYNKENTGYVILRTRTHKPIPKAHLTLHLPEYKTERLEHLVTDMLGRAKFSWKPDAQYGSRISTRIELPDGGVVVRNDTLHVEHRALIIRNFQALAHAGKAYTLELAATDRHTHIVITQRGLIIASKNLEPHHSGPITLRLPKAARGLAQVLVFDKFNNIQDKRALWVEQDSATHVEMRLDASTYKPGSKAVLDLSFPATAHHEKPTSDSAPADTPVDAPVDAPVTYGVVGVDEALYVLKERSNVPLSILMRQAPESIESVLEQLHQAHDDPVGQAIASSKFQTNIGHAHAQAHKFTHQNDLNYTLERKSMEARTRIASILWGILFLGCALWTAKRSWTSFTKKALSKKRLFALLGAGIAIVPVVFALMSIGRRGEAFAGGAFVWCLVLLGWLMGACWRDSSSGIRGWLTSLLVCMFCGAHFTFCMDSGRLSGDHERFASFVLISVAILFFIESVLWTFLLYYHKHMHAAFGLSTLVMGIAVAASAAFLFASTGAFMGSAAKQYESDSSVQRLSRPSSISFDNMKDEAPNRKSASEMDDTYSGAGAGASASATAKPRVRAHFPETMVWVPELASDKEGKARMEFKVPDSITTWRLNSYAHTWDGRFGEGQLGMLVKQPFFIHMELPKDFIQGDEFEVPITLVNHTDEPQQASLDFTAEGALKVISAPRSVHIDALARHIVTLKVRAQGLGKGSLRAISKTNTQGVGDAVRRFVHVWPHGRKVQATHAGFVQAKGWSPTADMPADMILDTGRSDFFVMPGPIAQAMEGLNSMLRKPTGCFEQTSSANYPNTIILNMLKHTKPKDWPGGAKAFAKARAQAKDFIALGYQRMLSFQKSHGGFGLYPDSKQAQVMLTAYGLMQLAHMSKVHPIDPKVLKKATHWLMNTQLKNGSFPTSRHNVLGQAWRSKDDDVGQVRATSFIVLAVMSLPQEERKAWMPQLTRAANRIIARIESVESPNALAYAANALLVMGRRGEATKILKTLEASMIHDGQVSYLKSTRPTWMGGYGRYADIEATALTAYTFILGEYGSTQLPRMLTYLARAQSAWGGWGSTQTTVWVLRTLMKINANTSGDATLRVTHNGALMPFAHGLGAPGKVEVKSKVQLLQQLGTNDVRRGTNTLSVEASGNSGAMVQWRVSCHVPWNSEAARPSEQERIRMTLNLPDHALFGAKVEVLAQIQNTRPMDLSALIVELPIPPGAYTPSAPFKALKKKGVIDRFDILPTHVRLYLNGLTQHTTKAIAYSFVPLLRGRFALPAARAYVFYAPDPATELGGKRFVVE